MSPTPTLSPLLAILLCVALTLAFDVLLVLALGSAPAPSYWALTGGLAAAAAVLLWGGLSLLRGGTAPILVA